MDINPEEHVKTQAVFQKHCDSSVSKTVNLQEEASQEDVRKVFELAYQLGCKGVTIYRDHSRPDQVLSAVGSGKESSATQAQSSSSARVAERPKTLQGFTEKIRTGYGNLYVTVNVLEGRPFEVFAHIGKSGYSTMADTEAICRMISLALRSGVEIGQIIRQLRGIGGASQVFSESGKVSSIPDAIAQVLQKRFPMAAKAAGKTDDVCRCRNLPFVRWRNEF